MGILAKIFGCVENDYTNYEPSFDKCAKCKIEMCSECDLCEKYTEAKNEIKACHEEIDKLTRRNAQLVGSNMRLMRRMFA